MHIEERSAGDVTLLDLKGKMTLGDGDDRCDCRYAYEGRCEWAPEKGFVEFSTTCTVAGKVVLDGTAILMAPRPKKAS